SPSSSPTTRPSWRGPGSTWRICSSSPSCAAAGWARRCFPTWPGWRSSAAAGASSGRCSTGTSRPSPSIAAWARCRCPTGRSSGSRARRSCARAAEARRQELQRQPVDGVGAAPAAGDEADVPAPRQQAPVEEGVGGDLGAGDARARHHGIVLGRDQPDRAADAAQEGGRRAAGPVVGGAGEAEERRRDQLVVAREGVAGPHRRDVEGAREARLQGQGLAAERAQEAPPVQGGEEAGGVEGGGAGAEIEGDRHRHRGVEGGALALLAQPLEEDVAAHGEADGAQRNARPARPQPLEHERQIGGVARVVEAPARHRGGAARAEAERGRVPAQAVDGGQQAPDVTGPGRALEPVQHEEAGAAGAIGQELEVERLAVAGGPALGGKARGSAPSEQRRPDGLGVAVAERPGGSEGLALQAHGWGRRSTCTNSAPSRSRRKMAPFSSGGGSSPVIDLTKRRMAPPWLMARAAPASGWCARSAWASACTEARMRATTSSRGSPPGGESPAPAL